jgi:hypothetical protein
MSTDRNLNHLSDAALASMTSDLDQMHNDHTQPAMDAAAADWSKQIREERGAAGPGRRRASRRTFLLGAAGATAGGLLLAACGSSSPSSSSGTTAASSPTTAAGGSGGASTDLAIAAMAASLENLAVFAYNAGLQAATAGKLGTVPPAVATFATTAMAQHKAHAGAWNSVLTGAGKPAVTVTDPAATPTVQAAFAKVTDVTGLAKLALLLENTAAQTYQNGIGVLTSTSAIGVAATIQPVEMQHAAILYFVLGQYPGIQGTQSNSYASGTPLAFNPVALARPPSDIGSTL